MQINCLASLELDYCILTNALLPRRALGVAERPFLHAIASGRDPGLHLNAVTLPLVQAGQLNVIC